MHIFLFKKKIDGGGDIVYRRWSFFFFLGLMKNDLPREYLPTQRSLGTNNMPWESCRRSAANTGCRYQSQHIVGLLRNACEAGTTLRWKDAVISVVSISQRAADPNICAHAKELYTFILPPMSCLPTP